MHFETKKMGQNDGTNMKHIETYIKMMEKNKAKSAFDIFSQLAVRGCELPGKQLVVSSVADPFIRFLGGLSGLQNPKLLVKLLVIN